MCDHMICILIDIIHIPGLKVKKFGADRKKIPPSVRLKRENIESERSLETSKGLFG